jgi:tight adherence protein B
MTGVVLATCAATGVYLIYTALLRQPGRIDSGGQGRRGGTTGPPARRLHVLRDAWARAGLADVRVRDVLAMGAVTAFIGGALALLVFGALLPAVVLAACVSMWPLAALRARRAEMHASSQDSWPRLIEEMRILISSVGRSVPQALFEAGRSAPPSLRPAFEAAHREWLLSTDFERTIGVLKSRLADPTADAACETLLVAHEIGGTDLDRRLEALIEDRIIDVQGRKDARSRQAGVRFARRFVLLVPCGMALLGMTIGSGRQAYGTSWGQMLVAIGLVVIVACWIWAGRLLKLPEEQRVFT